MVKKIFGARMYVRLAAVLAWTMALLPVQLVLIRRHGRAKRALPLRYWGGVARILGLQIQVIGRLAETETRPVLFVSNHTSWLDIVALGAVLPGCFIAKADVGRWPGISAVARAGRTIFVSRARTGAGRERAELAERLAAGDSLILFPEGTTSDGARVLPFRSSFLALAETDPPPLIQPVTIVYDRMDSLPVCRRNRPRIAWYGDMDIASHYAELGRHDWRATIVLDDPIEIDGGRKALTASLERQIAARAAAIRQGRFPGPFTKA
ncbi:unnamed protein product [Acidocella sp. C78]|uniref:lysophospholipid acyltransferase family protein n=1 Tax=Acidocella sp. C78 TaxID=1671486 RepID=UPI00191BA78F|nr:lysophospholipid acyltransferase family protein [Acidocella sp. C78]CAG4929654.1 unnamed protein product [Acidocella sp. C78]